jgi:hypothetical protein
LACALALGSAAVAGPAYAGDGADEQESSDIKAEEAEEAKSESDAPKDAATAGEGEQGKDEPVDENRRRARELFSKGSEFVRKSQWAEALGAFEQSAALRPHAVTRYNIGVCLRATGRYVEARKNFEQALKDDEAEDRGQLPDQLRDEARAFIKEIDGILVRLDVTLTPANGAIAVNGRPLEVVSQSNGKDRPVALAGTLPAGKGRQAPASRFTIVVNPGAHVFKLSRKGFEDAVVNKTFAPGAKEKLDLKINKLPATLVVDANEPEAVVTVDGRDVGYAPVTLSRPGGKYSVTVEKEGFTLFETTASVDPGEQWRVSADLTEEPPPLSRQWWFWTTMAGSIATVAVTTWFITRPDPKRPDPDGGGLDWVVYVPERAAISW